VSEVNFAELEEKYGKELAERIRREIEICEENGYLYSLEVVSGWVVDKIFLSTYIDTIIFRADKEKKVFIDKYRISRDDFDKAIEMMDRLWERGGINCSSTSIPS